MAESCEIRPIQISDQDTTGEDIKDLVDLQLSEEEDSARISLMGSIFEDILADSGLEPRKRKKPLDNPSLKFREDHEEEMRARQKKKKRKKVVLRAIYRPQFRPLLFPRHSTQQPPQPPQQPINVNKPTKEVSKKEPKKIVKGRIFNGEIFKEAKLTKNNLELKPPVKCCQETFKFSDHLKQHDREKHADGKYSCEYEECVKKKTFFKKRSQLKRHRILEHLRSKPFKCTFCNYSSAHRSNLFRHCKQKHISKLEEGKSLNTSEFAIALEMDPKNFSQAWGGNKNNFYSFSTQTI